MAIVTLEDMKAHLGLTTDDDDDLVTAKIDSATEYLAAQLGFDIETEFPDAVPADIIEAVRQLTAHLYENREATIVGVGVAMVPLSVEDTIRNRRSYAWGADAEG